MEFRKQQAIYMQIADSILENILSGEWRPGDKIQSVRALAASIQVNPNTAMRAYTYLQEQNIIYNKRGIGFFIEENAVDRTQKLKRTEFVEQFLPQVFTTMELLGISLEDFKKLYDTQRTNND